MPRWTESSKKYCFHTKSWCDSWVTSCMCALMLIVIQHDLLSNVCEQIFDMVYNKKYSFPCRFHLKRKARKPQNPKRPWPWWRSWLTSRRAMTSRRKTSRRRRRSSRVWCPAGPLRRSRTRRKSGTLLLWVQTHHSTQGVNNWTLFNID